MNAIRIFPWVLALSCVAVVFGCDREERRFVERSEKPTIADTNGTPRAELVEHYARNAFSVSEGQRLFSWFNCAGCHAFGGGGGMGPPLRDAKWIYGGELTQIHDSIALGRPNGMPKFGDKIPDPLIWQLASYVHSLSNRARKDAEPSRPESISVGVPPVMSPELTPTHEEPP